MELRERSDYLSLFLVANTAARNMKEMKPHLPEWFDMTCVPQVCVCVCACWCAVGVCAHEGPRLILGLLLPHSLTLLFETKATASSPISAS